MAELLQFDDRGASAERISGNGPGSRGGPGVMSPARIRFKTWLAALAGADRARLAAPRARLAAARGRIGRIAVIALIHALALGLMVWSEGDAVGRAAYLLAWGFWNCFWIAAAAPAGRRRGALARNVRRPGAAVAAQAQRPVHDGEFRRPDDHRSPTSFAFLMTVFPGLGRICRRGCTRRCADLRAAVVARSAADAHAHRLARRHPVRGVARRAVVFRAAGPRGGVLRTGTTSPSSRARVRPR